MNATARRRLWTYARLAGGILLLGLVLSRVDLGDLTVRSWPALLAAAAVATVLLLVAQALSAVRWRAVLGTHEVTSSYLWRLYLIGQFFGLFLPSLVGGDAVRAIALAREIHDPSRSITSILIDRMAGMVALGLYLLLGLALVPAGITPQLHVAWPQITGLWLGVAAAAVAAVGLAAVLILRRSARLRHALSGTLGVLRMVRQPPAIVARWIVLSLLVQGVYIVTWWTLDRGLHLNIGVRYLCFAVPLVNVVSMLPITFSGIGVREGAWVVLLGPLGVAGADAVAFSVAYFVCYSIVGALGGVIFTVYGTSVRRHRGETIATVAPEGASPASPSGPFAPPSRIRGTE